MPSRARSSQSRAQACARFRSSLRCDPFLDAQRLVERVVKRSGWASAGRVSSKRRSGTPVYVAARLAHSLPLGSSGSRCTRLGTRSRRICCQRHRHQGSDRDPRSLQRHRVSRSLRAPVRGHDGADGRSDQHMARGGGHAEPRRASRGRRPSLMPRELPKLSSLLCLAFGLPCG